MWNQQELKKLTGQVVRLLLFSAHKHDGAPVPRDEVVKVRRERGCGCGIGEGHSAEKKNAPYNPPHHEPAGAQDVQAAAGPGGGRHRPREAAAGEAGLRAGRRHARALHRGPRRQAEDGHAGGLFVRALKTHSLPACTSGLRSNLTATAFFLFSGRNTGRTLPARPCSCCGPRCRRRCCTIG